MGIPATEVVGSHEKKNHVHVPIHLHQISGKEIMEKKKKKNLKQQEF